MVGAKDIQFLSFVHCWRAGAEPVKTSKMAPRSRAFLEGAEAKAGKRKLIKTAPMS